MFDPGENSYQRSLYRRAKKVKRRPKIKYLIAAQKSRKEAKPQVTIIGELYMSIKNIKDKVWSQVRDQVWDQVEFQVWDQISEKIGDQVRFRISRQVRRQVRDQVWDQVAEKQDEKY